MRTNLFYFLLISAIFFVADPLFAASPTQKVTGPKTYAHSGETVKTEYFSVTLPNGWLMPEQINRRPPAMSAVFWDQKTGIAVTVNVLKIPVPAKDLALQVMGSMRKGGLKTGQLQQIKNLYRVPLTGKASGEAWFGSNGEICTATVILGEKMNRNVANEFLKVFNPVNKDLYPASMQ